MTFTQALITPERYFEYLSEKEEFPSFPLPKVVLFFFQKTALNHVLSRNPHQWGKGFLSKIAFLQNSEVAICGGFGVGAPALAVKLEELIACGVERFISFGTACAINPNVPLHTLVVCKTALAEDGVSRHYSNKTNLDADVGVVQLVSSYASKERLQVRTVNSVTTDLLYGTSKTDLQRWGRAIDVLDMESAAFYAIAQKRNVSACALFTTSDSLAEGQWIPGFDSEETAAEIRKGAEFAINFCQECS